MLRAAAAIGSVSTSDVDETLPSASEITRYGLEISSLLPSHDIMHTLPQDKRLPVPQKVIIRQNAFWRFALM